MGGGQSLTPEQITQQGAIDQQQLQYYQLMNSLNQNQLNQFQPSIGVPTSQWQSMGFSPQSADPWSYMAYG